MSDARFRFTGPTILILSLLALPAAAAAQTAHFAGGETIIADAATGLLRTSNSVPWGIAADSQGNVYVAVNGTGYVLKESPSGGGYAETVVASSQSPYSLSSGLQGIAVDGSGNVYVCDYQAASGHYQVVKETPSAGGYTQTVVASGSGNGVLPVAVAVDGSGNVYIANYNSPTILKETLIGGSYTASTLTFPGSAMNIAGVAVDGSGNIYIAGVPSAGQVLKETPSGASFTQTTVASGLGTVTGVAVGAAGSVYISEVNNLVGGNGLPEVLKETLSGGTYTQSTVTIPGVTLLSSLGGVAVDSNGNVYTGGAGQNGGSAMVLEAAPLAGGFGTVGVGTSGALIAESVMPVLFTFDTGGTLGSTAVLTQGATGLDFANAGTGTCTANTPYTAGESCTVNVTFTPAWPGARYGAVELLGSSGAVLATAYVYGMGSGPQMSFLPGAQSTLFAGLSSPDTVGVDGGGNVYIADNHSNLLYKETLSGGGYAQSTFGTGLKYPWGVAVDGAGNVYTGDSGNSRVLQEAPSAGSYSQSQVGGTFYGPLGVAVDKNGSVYFTKENYANLLYVETPSAGAFSQSTVPTVGLSFPRGIAVDISGDVYVTDGYNGLVVKETPSAGGYTQTSIGSGSNNPQGVAVDGNGIVYIAATWGAVYKETPSASGYTETTLAVSGLNNPYGVAVAPNGNLYIANQGGGQVLRMDYADPPSLTFQSTASGSTSSDSPQTVTIQNIGNRPLTFSGIALSNTQPGANFQINSGATTCSTSSPLAPFLSCVVAVSFTPTSGGSLAGTLTLTDNALNAANATQAVSLSGPATGAVATTTTLGSSLNPSVSGQSVTITATVTAASGNTTPTGTVQFKVDGSAAGSAVTLNGGIATYTSSTMAVGTHSITAVFTPASNAAFNASTAAALSQVVNAPPVATTTTLGSSLNPSAVGQSVTITATVSPASGSVTPAGTVQFSVDGSAAGPAVTLSGGTATYVTSTLAVGTHSITAAFTPASSAAFNASTATALSQTVTTVPQTIAFTAPATPVVYGVAPISLVATASSGLAVTFSVVSGPGTVSNSTLTITGVGTVVVAANQAGNATYAAAPQVTRSVVVTPIGQTISFAALYNQVLGMAPFTVGASASSGLTVAFASTTSTVCTVSGATVTLVGLGTCTIQAAQAGGGNYAAATSVSRSFPVTQYSMCDPNHGGVANVADVQVIINEALGVVPPTNDLNEDGVVNVVEVQIVINAALGLGCDAT